MTQKAEWTVVQFINELDNGAEAISTVPIKWLTYFNGTTFSWWPKAKVRKHIQTATIPDEAWDKFEVVVLLETPVSYEEAIIYEKKKGEKERDSSSDIANIAPRKRPFRKRRKVRHAEYVYSSNDENGVILKSSTKPFVADHLSNTDTVACEEAIAYENTKGEMERGGNSNMKTIASSKRPSRKRIKFRHAESTSSSNDENEVIPNAPIIPLLTDHLSNADTASVTSADVMPPPPPPTKETSTNTLYEHINVTIDKENMNIFNDAGHSEETGTYKGIVPSNDREYVETTSLSGENSFSYGEYKENPSLSEKLDHILKQTTANRILLERILNSLPGPGQNSRVEENFDTLPDKAFFKYSELMKYDQKLKEDTTMQQQLLTVFTLIGGRTAKEQIIRGLRKMFEDKLAKKCSWLGRRGNYEIGTMMWTMLLKGAVRKTFVLTDKEFETVVSNWLRQAKLRYMRKKHSIRSNL